MDYTGLLSHPIAFTIEPVRIRRARPLIVGIHPFVFFSEENGYRDRDHHGPGRRVDRRARLIA
jgi:hypothetical protein